MRWLYFLFIFSALYPEQIQLGKEILNVEIVKTHESRNRGLMGRKKLSQGEGMLFVYEGPEILVFWMKNTLIPLSIAFFDVEKELINILDMDPPTGFPLHKYRSSSPALYALEVPQGWFAKHRIGPGVKFSFLDQSDQVQ